ncbi:MAG: carboxypeptidase regulatory-like domain-containing protein [Gammaproteobacteria bacterium]
MNAGLPVAALLAALLAVGALAATVRLGLRAHAGLLPPSRAALIAALQCCAALFLYWTLLPPETTRDDGVLTVLTAGADGRGTRGTVVALPEFLGQVGEPAPDLATASRRHPEATRLEIRGAGLTPRDLDAARGFGVRFQPTPPPAGLTEVHLPGRITAGTRWSLRGRVTALPGGRVELRDPAGVRVGQALLDDSGGFELPVLARAPGPVEFELRVFEVGGREIERATLPVAAVPGARPRVLLLAGAPSAELRFLRRWAVDAGIDLETRIRLTRGVSLGTEPTVDAATLRDTDLLLLDERVWRALDGGQRALIRDAAREGLGVMLRIGDALDEADRASLAELGFLVEHTQLDALSTSLSQGTDASRAANGAVTLTRRPVSVSAVDGAVLLRSATGEPLALWRSTHRGRIALWWLDDSYRLALGGEEAAYATLWGDVVGTLGRARESAAPDPGKDAGVHRRRVLCGLSPDARVRGPSGQAVALVVREDGCAGYWPAQSGWHALVQGDDVVDFHVRGDGTSPGLEAAQQQADTRLLEAQPYASAAAKRAAVPGSPWPFFIGWLITAGLPWWLERRHRWRRTQA